MMSQIQSEPNTTKHAADEAMLQLSKAETEGDATAIARARVRLETVRGELVKFVADENALQLFRAAQRVPLSKFDSSPGAKPRPGAPVAARAPVVAVAPVAKARQTFTKELRS